MKFFRSVFFSLSFITSFVSHSADKKCTLVVDQTIYSPSDVMEEINKLNNPHLILWYSGESSLVEDGAQFYKDELFARRKQGKFYLYDLAAWEGLRKKKEKITVRTKLSQRINSIGLPHIQAIHSADFLEDLAKETRQEVIEYNNNVILKDPYLFNPSNGRKPNGILVKEKIPASSVATLHEYDTAHAYSALQYLEGIYLVKHILNNAEEESSNVVFLLPNDEYKYYVTPNLERDLSAHLSFNGLVDKAANVAFKCFKYGQSEKDRPYILRGKKVTDKTIDGFLK